MAKKHKHPAHENLERWLISYADFITLLFAVFVALWALKRDNPPPTEVIEGIRKGFNAFEQKSGAQDTVVALTPAGGSPAVFSFIPMYQNIEKGMKQIGIKGSSVNKVEQGVVIRIPDEALFEPGRSLINEGFKGALDQTAELLKTLPNKIQIEGHTDNIPISTPAYPSNWELSTARAMAIMRYFVEKNEMPPEKFAVAGYSEYHPIDTNDTPEGRAKNRRIDILVVKSPQEKKPPALPALPATPALKGH
ncbi:MAG: OmpA family protein [Nitrospirota bacterium]